MRHRGPIAIRFAAAVACAVLAAPWPALGQTVFVRPAATPGWIGVGTRDVTGADVASDRLPGEWGAYVNDVASDGPAQKAGIRTGDIIVEFDGVRVRSSAELQRLVRETPPGRAVKIGIMRAGKRVEVAVTTERGGGSSDWRFDTPDGRSFVFPSPEFRPDFREGPLQQPHTYRLYPEFPPRTSPQPSAPRTNTPRLGISVQDLTPQLAEYFHTRDGVLVSSVEDGSPAARAGLKAGDILTSVDGRTVAQSGEVRAALREKRPGDEVALGIVRDGKPLTITVKLEGARSDRF